MRFAYSQALDRGRVKQLWPFYLLAVMLLGQLAVPDVQVGIVNQVLLVAVAAIGYNVMLGNAGQFSFGQAAFLAIGAFAATVMALQFHSPFLVAVLAGAVGATVAGVVIGIPSLRLRSHYLVFTTFALHFGTIFALTKLQTAPSGYTLPHADLFGFDLAHDQRRWFLLNAILLVLVAWFVTNLLRGKPGRAWTIIREHSTAAAIAGINVHFWRIAIFAFSSFVFGFMGAVQAYYIGHVSIEDFTLDLAVMYIVAVLVGGLGSVLGSVVGSVVVVLIPYLLSSLVTTDLSQSVAPGLAREEFILVSIVYGVLIVAVMLLWPRGLAAIVTARRPSIRLPKLGIGRPARRARAASRLRAPARASALEVRNLTVAYGDSAPVVSELSMQIEPGAVVTLLGPNGAGKTSVLTAIAGQLAGSTMRTQGEALFAGVDLTRLRAAEVSRRGVCLVPERDKVFRGLSIHENLSLGLTGSRRERRETLAALYESFPRLKAIDRRRASALLSGGERQMLALAMAMACHPKLLILDEPSLGLAPIAVSQLGETIKELRKTYGLSILMAEQNVVLALAVSDRVAVLENGRLMEEGAAAEWDVTRIHHKYLGRKDAAIGKTAVL